MADINFNVNAKVAGAKKVLGDFASGIDSKLGVLAAKFPLMAKGVRMFGIAGKVAFKMIATGIAATGIGALVLAVVGLISYFKRTQEGADKLARVMAGFGAAVAVITDRFSAFGKVVVDAFSNPKQAIKDLWESLKRNIVNRVTGIIDMFGSLGKVIKGAFTLDLDSIKEGASEAATAMVQITTGLDEQQQSKVGDFFKSVTQEIKEESKAASELAGELQKVRNAELEMITAKAEMRKAVAEARLDAMDETKTQQERIDALNKVKEIELAHTQELIKIQEDKIAAMGAEIALGNSLHAEFVEHENAKAALIDLNTKSIMTQKRLQGEVEALTIEMEGEANKRRALELKAKKILDEEELAAALLLSDEKLKIYLTEVAEKKKADEKAAKEKEKLDATVEKTRQGLIKQGFGLAKDMAGENAAASKAFAVAETIYSTQRAIMAATADEEIPYPLRIANAIGAGIMGAASVAKILSTDPNSASASGSAPTAPTAEARPISGAFSLGEGTEPEPMKAFVVADEMTDSQAQLSDIRRRATI